MPFNRSLYPPDWESISSRIRHGRAKGRCEWIAAATGERCAAENGKKHPVTGSRVVLTVAHLDHDTTNNDPANLMAMCQHHHLKYDAGYHAENARRTRARKYTEQQTAAGQMELL